MNLASSTLILVGHGSTTNTDSSRPTHLHAEELRGRQIFSEVLPCFWKEKPGIAETLAAARSAMVFVVPLFISDGYFTQQIIPRELGLSDGIKTDFSRRQNVGSRTVIYCAPVGSHTGMTAALLRRANEIVAQYPFPHAPSPANISLFVAGHGTGQNDNSRKAIERQVQAIRARNVYASVHDIYMEESPRIEECYNLATARNIVVVPFFISDGLHAREDIPVMLGEPAEKVRERMESGQAVWRNPTEKRGKRVWYSEAIGSEPGMAEVILELVRDASHT